MVALLGCSKVNVYQLYLQLEILQVEIYVHFIDWINNQTFIDELYDEVMTQRLVLIIDGGYKRGKELNVGSGDQMVHTQVLVEGWIKWCRSTVAADGGV